jgi:glycosyltransferase involved in cell wall biosynthesis
MTDPIEITPLILTFNEAPNIRRTLAQLSWAKDIVVVDSGSTDATREILAGVPQVRVFERRFTTHAEQWNYGLETTGIATEWVLAMDADYVVSDALNSEIQSLAPTSDTAGYSASFKYCLNGRTLRGAVYPPVVVLYRRSGAKYMQDGHTQRIRLTGRVLPLAAPIYHDDRKPVEEWRTAQQRYMRLEARKIREARFLDLDYPDRLRRLVFVAPIAMFLHCLISRGGLLDGRAGLSYALQRARAELILSRYLLKGET